MKHSKDKGACFKMDATEVAIMDVTKQLHNPSPLEEALTNALNNIDFEEQEIACLPYETKLFHLKKRAWYNAMHDMFCDLRKFILYRTCMNGNSTTQFF
jgi:hypothetical protein